MEYSVKLARLPDEVTFPARLRDRVNYDSAKGLCYRGFMTKCAYDELSGLSDDAEYHRALEQLFVLTSEEVAQHSAKGKLPAATLVATIGATALVAGSIWFMLRHSAGGKPAAGGSDMAVSSATR